MVDNTSKNELLASETTQEIRKFYSFLAMSILASFFMVGMAILIFINDESYAKVPVLILLSTPIVFTVILYIEYLRVFEKRILFGKDWEERQISKQIAEQKKTTTKYI
ncbi:2TM domain-containing protein [Aurantibacter sp.]|uniref:2TM domain-containing protein n=1 Tax=Aurantibacter sp. TaxID=2807103 RepID=UPI0032637193